MKSQTSQPRPNHPRKSAQQAKKPKPVRLQNNYAFIDSQNLNLGVQKLGWKMDWRKFRLWLQEKHGVTHAYMFIGYMAENEALYELMHEHGYLIVLKPTLEIKADTNTAGDSDHKEDQKPVVKGNIDADLVLYAMKEYPNYDKAVIVSGDGDFFGLVEYLAAQEKLLKLFTPNQRYSTLLKEFEAYTECLDGYRTELAYRDRRHIVRRPKHANPK
ncbi:MAG TPA: NYN domain-containing protein [Candidatus Saccharimonadia bacterium]|nr:NYN domain-containing protein [Candidatus Saccharimonadia bacterium]